MLYTNNDSEAAISNLDLQNDESNEGSRHETESSENIAYESSADEGESLFYWSQSIASLTSFDRDLIMLGELNNKAQINMSEQLFENDKLNQKLWLMLSLSTTCLFLLSLLGFVLGIVFIVNGLFRPGIYAVCAGLIPSLFSTTISRIWSYCLYESNHSITKLSTHFGSGILYALINIEPLYYLLKHKKFDTNTDDNDDNFNNMKMVAVLMNDCQHLLCFALASQAAAHIAVQIYTITEYQHFILTLTLQIAILCLSVSAIITAVVLYFSYKFDDIMATVRRVTLLTCILKVPSIALYGLDVYSDWLLAIRYLIGHQWIYGCLTILFIIGPSICMTWYLRNSVSYANRNQFMKGVIGVFNIGPIIEHVKALRRIYKIKKFEIENGDWHYSQYKKLALKEFLVQGAISVECYMESAMQAILQLSITFNEREYDALRLFTIGTSLASIAMSMLLLNRKRRIYQNVSKDDLPIQTDPKAISSVATLFVGDLTTVGPRILVLGLFAAVQPCCAAAFIITNWTIVMMHQIYKEKYPSNEALTLAVIHNIVYVFMPINLISLKSEVGFHVFYWLQNFVLSLIWYSSNTTVSETAAIFLLVFCNTTPVIGWICRCTAGLRNILFRVNSLSYSR